MSILMLMKMAPGGGGGPDGPNGAKRVFLVVKNSLWQMLRIRLWGMFGVPHILFWKSGLRKKLEINTFEKACMFNLK